MFDFIFGAFAADVWFGVLVFLAFLHARSSTCIIAQRFQFYFNTILFKLSLPPTLSRSLSLPLSISNFSAPKSSPSPPKSTPASPSPPHTTDSANPPLSELPRNVLPSFHNFSVPPLEPSLGRGRLLAQCGGGCIVLGLQGAAAM